MALTATATQGLGLHRYIADSEVIYVPGDPGDTFTRDHPAIANVAAAGVGVIDEASDSSASMIGMVAKTTVCPAATQGFPLPGAFLPRKGDAESLTLVPVRPRVAAGTPVYKASFANHWDDTVVSYTAATRAIACTTGMSADDYPNGGLLYVYEGTGAGQVNVVEDYDHTGGAAELLLICHRAFATALDSTSKFIVVGGEAVANYGISQFGRMDLDTNRALDASDGANDGDYVVYADWSELGELLKNLTITVIDASAIY
jgi:hypothetical protein